LSKDYDLRGLPMISSDSFTNNLDQHPLPPPPVKFSVEDPLPRAKVEAAIGDGDDNLAPHDQQRAAGFCCPLQMRVGVVFTGAVVQPAPGPAWSLGACGASLSSHTS